MNPITPLVIQRIQNGEPPQQIVDSLTDAEKGQLQVDFSEALNTIYAAVVETAALMDVVFARLPVPTLTVEIHSAR